MAPKKINSEFLYVQTERMEPVSLFCLADIDESTGLEMIAVTQEGMTAISLSENRIFWETKKKLEGRAVLTSYQLPIAADMNSDGALEILALESQVLSGERRDSLVLLDSRGEEIWSQDTGGFIMGLTAGDLDGDGFWEIVYTSARKKNKSYVSVRETRSGSFVWKHEVSGNSYSHPLIADVDSDGKGEVVLLAHYYPETKENLFCFSHKGEVQWIFRLAGMSYSSPIAAEFLKDGGVQIAVGGSAEYYLIDGETGKPVWRYKTGGLAGHIFDLWNAGIGDLNGDGHQDIVFVVKGTVHAVNGKTGQVLWTYILPFPGSFIGGNALLCDLNGDDRNEVVLGLNPEYYRAMVFLDQRGKLLGDFLFPSEPHASRFFNFSFDEEKQSLVFFAGENNDTLHTLNTRAGTPILEFNPKKESSKPSFFLKRWKVSSSLGQSINPSWSLDGRKLTFQSFSKPRLFSEKKREKIADVVLDIYDVQQDKIKTWDLREKDLHISILYPQWTFSGRNIGLLINGSDFRKVYRTLSLLDPETGQNIVLKDSSDLFYLLKPIWDDQGRVYLPTFRNSLDRWKWGENGTKTEIIPSEKGGFAFSLSPDGRKICWVSVRDNYSLWIAGINGENIQKISHDLFTFPFPSWSRDSRKIAFCRIEDGKSLIQAVDLTTDEVTTLVNDEFNNTAPILSPKDNRLVYCSERGGDYFIVLLDLDRNSPSILTFCRVMDPRFTWSPDGRHVAYCDKTNGLWNTYLLDLEQLTENP